MEKLRLCIVAVKRSLGPGSAISEMRAMNNLCDSVIPRWLDFQGAFSNQYGCDFLRWALLSQLERRFFCMEGDFHKRRRFLNGKAKTATKTDAGENLYQGIF